MHRTFSWRPHLSHVTCCGGSFLTYKGGAKPGRVERSYDQAGSRREQRGAGVDQAHELAKRFGKKCSPTRKARTMLNNPYGCHSQALTGPAKNTMLAQRNGRILKLVSPITLDRNFLEQMRANNPRYAHHLSPLFRGQQFRRSRRARR